MNSETETLQRKLADALAENERLRKIIDDAQKQDPVAYGLKDYPSGKWGGDSMLTLLEATAYDENALVPLYAAPVPAQSPRITDQDAKEIVNYQVRSPYSYADFFEKPELFSPILEKLNGNKS